ncbi:hypothetical protein RYX36_029288 [Vicia faba]
MIIISSRSHFIYVRDEHDLFSVVNFNVEEGQHLKSSNHLSKKIIREFVGFLDSSNQPIVEILSQSYSFGNKLFIMFQDGLLILWEVSEAKSVFLDCGKDLELKYKGDNNSKMETNFPTDNLEQSLGDQEISVLCWESDDGSIFSVDYLERANSSQKVNQELSLHVH